MSFDFLGFGVLAVSFQSRIFRINGVFSFKTFCLGFHLLELGILAVTVRVFYGNRYLLQSKTASRNWLLFGKLARSYGCGTMEVCMRLFTDSIGATKFKCSLLLFQASLYKIISSVGI